MTRRSSNLKTRGKEVERVSVSSVGYFGCTCLKTLFLALQLRVQTLSYKLISLRRRSIVGPVEVLQTEMSLYESAVLGS